MSNTDNIQGYKKSFRKLLKGINKSVDLLEESYGFAGGNILIEESLPPQHRVASDGKLITDATHLGDPIEKMGKNVVGAICDLQEKKVRDGRKTTAILGRAILKQGHKERRNYWFQFWRPRVLPRELKRQLDECLPLIVRALDEKKKGIDTDLVEKVASISSESKEIGKLIGEAYSKIGKDGIIEVEPSSLPDTFYELSDGFRIRQGWLGGYWQTEEGKCVLKNPKILVSREKITSVDQITGIYKELSSNGINEIVIFCDDIDLAVANRAAYTSSQGSFKTLLIKAPVLWKDWVFEDLCLLTGATSVDLKKGKSFNSFQLSDLGTCETLVCSETETRLTGLKNVDSHITQLKEKAKENEQIKLRISWLNTKVAVLKVGAHSDTDLSWKIKKSLDAVNAAHYALQDGVVIGAGNSLKDISLPDTIGGKILSVALKRPALVQEKNAGGPVNSDGVWDAAIVVKSAVESAISIAGTILTAKGALTIPQEIKDLMLKMSQQPR